MGQEAGFCVEYMDVLEEIVLGIFCLQEAGLTADASEGTSPCRLRTISTSCITSNIG